MWVHLGRKRRGKAIPHGARGAPAPTPPLPEAESSRRLANEINSHFTAALAPGTMCENYYSLRFVGKREEKEKKKKKSTAASAACASLRRGPVVAFTNPPPNSRWFSEGAQVPKGKERMEGVCAPSSSLCMRKNPRGSSCERLLRAPPLPGLKLQVKEKSRRAVNSLHSYAGRAEAAAAPRRSLLNSRGKRIVSGGRGIRDCLGCSVPGRKAIVG